MDLVVKIIIQTIEILTLIFGILGIILSLLILFSLDTTKSLSEIFNSTVNIDKNIKCLDKHIQTENFFYKHNLFIGTGLTVASVFFINFLFFQLDIDHFLKALSIPVKYFMLSQVISNSMALFGKISGITGFFTGIALLLMPGTLHRLENKLNFWLSTQTIEEKLNEIHKDTDTICFLHPLLFGTLGLLTSVFLTILSILNLLN